MFDDFSAFDFLTASDRSFALYRIPGHSPELILQKEGFPDAFDSLAELNGREGFVMAPFQSSEDSPVVLIRPDVVVHGIGLIKRELKALKHVIAAKVPSEVSAENVTESDLKTAGSVIAKSSGLGEKRKGAVPDGFDQYKTAFEMFQKALHAGSCDKIVLSRTLQLPLPKGFSAGSLFGAACEAYPDAFVYWCHTPMTGTWFGSTPELLLSGEKGHWQTVALAGTRRIKASERNLDGKNKISGETGASLVGSNKAGETGADWDGKNIREQQVVTAYLEKQLRIKNLIASISEPYTVRAGQLMHIKTDFRFQMPDQGCVGDLLDFLHPTPAVCGYPKTEACRLILAHEGYDRSYYSGFVGPMNNKGKTDLFVNLRCAQMTDRGLTLYAGGGLMPDSELKSEWEETEVKLQTLLSLLHAER